MPKANQYVVVTAAFGVRFEDWPRTQFSDKKKANEHFIKESQRVKKSGGGYVSIVEAQGKREILKRVEHPGKPNNLRKKVKK
jgi:hypothetical protein